jgi:hypothetical protein
MLVRLKDSASVATCEPWPNPLKGTTLKAHAINSDRHPSRRIPFPLSS